MGGAAERLRKAADAAWRGGVVVEVGWRVSKCCCHRTCWDVREGARAVRAEPWRICGELGGARERPACHRHFPEDHFPIRSPPLHCRALRGGSASRRRVSWGPWVSASGGLGGRDLSFESRGSRS